MNSRISSNLLAAGATAATLLGAQAILAHAGPIPHAKTSSVTLAGQVVVPSGATSAVLSMAPPQCDPAQSFVATALSGSPDPTATFPNGTPEAARTPPWGAEVPLAQQTADGIVRTSKLTFAVVSVPGFSQQGALFGEAHLPGGVPVVLQHNDVPVTITIFGGHNDITLDVAVTGHCAATVILPSD